MAGPFYIVFEGAEGCGKSTHARRLAEAIDAVITRETGGTAIGQRLREILHDTSVTDLDDRAEALIVAADRAQHFAEVVHPALAAGRHVVSDRSVYSTLAYQGYGRGLPLDELRHINRWAMGDTWPDLVLLLDRARRRRRRAAPQARARPVRAGRRRVPRPGRRRVRGDGRRRSRSLGRASTPPRPKDDVAAAVRAAVRDRLGAVSTAPVPHVGVGRRRRPGGRRRAAAARRRLARARVPVRRPVGLDQEGGRPRVRGACC